MTAPEPMPETLNVLLATPRGFCAGVVRAVDIVEQALARYVAPVYVRHEIVHNRHVVETLRDRGAVFVEELREVPAAAVTIFSAHGVARAVEAEARTRELTVIDATCPLVAKVHAMARRYAREGRALVLIGHPGHAEVVGTIGQVDAIVHVVADAPSVARLTIDPATPVAYVTQTTLSVDDTREIIAALAARFPDLVGPDVASICYATQNRQRAVRELAAACDVVLVVGASNSSNANRLCEIGNECGCPTFLIEDGDALNAAWIGTARTAGVTAGASTPEAQIDHVLAALARLRPVTVAALPGIVEDQVFGLPAAVRHPARD